LRRSLRAAAILGVILGAVLGGALPAQGSGDPQRGAALAEARGCGACHGERGVALLPETPSLAAMPAEFTVLQLILFREGLRDVPAMTVFARGLTDPEIEDLAAWFASLPAGAPPDRGAREETLLERGAVLAKGMHCASCHLPDYRGRAQMPRLAGQREEYLRHALTQYRDNRRVGSDTQMNGLMYGVADADIAALAHFLAQLP
jgi:cytochrome c553